MKCEECVAYGRDHISRLCAAGFVKNPPKSFNGIETFNDGSNGCKLHKKTIEKCRAEIDKDPVYSKKISFYRGCNFSD